MRFGSAGTALADALSDQDLLVVLRDGGLHKQLLTLAGKPCDLIYVSEAMVLSHCSLSNPKNNNPVLRALATGEQLLGAERMAELVADARSVFAQGPAKPAGEEVRLFVVAAVQTMQFIEKCRVRAATEQVWECILDARLGTFLTWMVEAYCRLNRLWCDAFWRLLRAREPEYLELAGLIRSFLDAPDRTAKQGAIYSLADRVASLGSQML